MGLSVYELAKAIKVPRSRANNIVRGRRAVTVDTALRLARYFGMRQNSGLIFRHATILTRRARNCANRSNKRSSRERPVYSGTDRN